MPGALVNRLIKVHRRQSLRRALTMVGIRPTQFHNEKAPHIQTEELVEACKWLKATGFPQYVQDRISGISFQLAQSRHQVI